MPRQAALRIGEGAHCSVLISRLRPNKANDQRLTDLKAVCVARTSRRGHVYNAVFFTSESVPGVKLFCASCYAVVAEEGLPDRLWWGATAREAAPVDDIPDETGDPIDITTSKKR